jgi:hypothetical protein
MVGVLGGGREKGGRSVGVYEGWRVGKGEGQMEVC